MRLDRNELTKAVQTALSLGAVAAVGVAGTAFAQNAAPAPQNGQQPQTLQTIVVTGSHIRRVDIETDNPVITVTSQQIAATGKLTVGSVVQDLPAITGGVQNPAINNGGGTGATLVGLRGLGPSRTLVLVDGQRVIGAPFGGGAVDLNSIPTAAVEQIQVLTSGASAIYGSDAIGGVINIILKSNYQGAQFSANYGISDHNDGERKGASFVFGQTSDKGSILAGVSYNKFDEISAANRKFSTNALSLGSSANGAATVHVGGSTFAARDFITVPDTVAAKFGCPGGTDLSLNTSTFNSGTSPTGAGDYHCFGSSDRYNFAAVNLIETPQERTSGFFKGVYHLSDNVDFYGTVYHNKTSSAFQLAPAVFGTSTVAPGPFISKDSMYNPFGVDFTTSNGNTYRARTFGAGNRVAEDGTTTDELLMGFKGNFNIGQQNWQWDVGYNYGHTSFTSTVLGLPNSNTLVPGLGPSMLVNGVPTCVATPGDPSSAIAGCTPWDPFNLNSPSAKAAMAAAATPALENLWAIERTYHAGINGGVVDLPAGTVQMAVGVDYRKEYQNNAIGGLIELNPATLTCTLGSQCSAHLQGGYNVKEAYAEVLIPILKDMPFAHGLNVTLADRYSKYSDFGSTSNWKIGVEWRPIEDLLVRGTVAKVFRAPTVGDLFGAPVSSAPFISTDPCDGITTAGNPACVGVPTNGSYKSNFDANSQQLQGINEGFYSAGIKPAPELGKSFDFGGVYSPHFVPGLSASVDLWRIYLNDTITRVGAQTVLDQCFAGNTTYCPFIQRQLSGAAAGQILHIIQPEANLGRFDVKGIDLAASYRLPAFAFGQFTLAVQGTYMSQYKIQTAPGAAGNEVFNGAGVMGWFGSPLESVCPFGGAPGAMCFNPRVRGQGTLDWQLGPWSAQWRMRYIGKYKLSTGGVADVLSPQQRQFGATVYNDLSVGYDIAPINTSIRVGVDNVMDKQPPIFWNLALNANTDPEDFDVIGRYYFANMTVKF